MYNKETKQEVKREKKKNRKEKYNKKQIIEVFDKKKNKNDNELYCLKFKGENRKKWIRIDNFDNSKRKFIIDLYSNNPQEKKEEARKKIKNKKRKLSKICNTISKFSLDISKIKPNTKLLNNSDKKELELVKNCLEECFLVKEESSTNKEKENIEKIYDRDILKSISIKNHIIIKNKLLFSLNWKTKSTNRFYSNTYFEFEKLEKKIPSKLLKYIKKQLIYDITN